MNNRFWLPVLFLSASCAAASPTPSDGHSAAVAPSDAAAPAPAPSVAETAPDAAAAPVATAAEPPLPAPGPPEVTVLDPGSDPKRALRYSFRKKPEVAVMDMKMAISVNASGPKGVARMPTARTTLAVVPTDVAPDGTMTASFEIKKAEVLADEPLAPERKSQFAAELQTMVGLKGSVVATSRGLTTDASVELPPGMAGDFSESIKDSVRYLCSPFPEEALGKGARWKVKTVLAGKITIVQEATYTLTELTATGATVEVALVQSAPPQAMKPSPQLPPNATMRLAGYEGQGSGTQHVNFDQLTPTSRMQVTSKSALEVEVDSHKQGMTLEIGLGLTIRRR